MYVECVLLILVSPSAYLPKNYAFPACLYTSLNPYSNLRLLFESKDLEWILNRK
jgi:hypothetical protein